MNVSFESISQTCVTFRTTEAALTGKVVKITDNATVGTCADGERFCGAAVSVRDGVCAVVIGGYVELPYTGTAPAVGYTGLSANGTGGVKADAEGHTYLVVQVDESTMTAGLFL